MESVNLIQVCKILGLDFAQITHKLRFLVLEQDRHEYLRGLQERVRLRTRDLQARSHPDRGGSETRFKQIGTAFAAFNELVERNLRNHPIPVHAPKDRISL